MKTRSRLFALVPGLALALGFFIAPSVHAANLCGYISSDTTWVATTTYYVTCDVTIETGVRVDVNPGALIKFMSSTKLTVLGTLNARGDAENYITFTASTTTPTAGYWDEIYLNHASASATLAYTTVEYGGSLNYTLNNNIGRLTVEHSYITNNTFYAIYHSNTSSFGYTTVTDSTISDSSIYGIYQVGKGSINFSGNTFTDNAKAVNLNLGYNFTFTNSGNSFTGSGKPTITIAGTLEVDQTLRPDGLSYVISTNVTVPAGITLYLDPGAVVKFDGGTSKIQVNSVGVLKAQGNATSRIYFTSIHDDEADGIDADATTTSPSASDWQYLDLRAGASSTISYAVVRYGSYGVYNFGTLNVFNSEVSNNVVGLYHGTGTLNVDQTAIHNNSSQAVLTYSGTANITNSILSYSQYGLLNSGTVNVSGSTFHHNTSYGSYSYAGGTATVINSLFHHNTNNITPTPPAGSGDIYDPTGNVVGGTLTADAEWTTATTYVIFPSLTVPSGVTLTIDPGVVVKFATTSSKLTVEGGLGAYGETWNDIYFTSFRDDDAGGDTNNDGPTSGAAGDWDGIQLNTGASATITHAVVRYGGYVSGVASNIYNNGGWLSVENTIIATGTTYGVRQPSGTSTITATEFHHHTRGVSLTGGTSTISLALIHDHTYGVYASGGVISVRSSTIKDNTSYGILNNSSGSTINAIDNYWGDNSGPYHATLNPDGMGDTVSDDVDFDPWDTVQHFLSGKSAVDEGEIRWDFGGSTTTQFASQWYAAVDTWNALGEIVIATDTATTVRDLTLIEIDESDYPWDTITGAYDHDWILADELYLNAYTLEGGTDDEVQNTCTHELGHALGLDHSLSSNVMYAYQTSQTTLGSQDTEDYNYLWSD